MLNITGWASKELRQSAHEFKTLPSFVEKAAAAENKQRFVVGETTGFLEPGRSPGGHSPNHQKNRRSAEPRTIFVADRLWAMRVLREWRTETAKGPGGRSNLERIERIRAEAAAYIAELEAGGGRE